MTLVVPTPALPINGRLRAARSICAELTAGAACGGGAGILTAGGAPGGVAASALAPAMANPVMRYDLTDTFMIPLSRGEV
jgi:hypothetical protein